MISRPHQIADRHLRRRAVVYVRQSSPEQVRANIGSAAVQRDLVQRLAAWGWQSSMIDLLDDDLGITGSRAGARDGFNHLLERMQVEEGIKMRRSDGTQGVPDTGGAGTGEPGAVDVALVGVRPGFPARGSPWTSGGPKGRVAWVSAGLARCRRRPGGPGGRWRAGVECRESPAWRPLGPALCAAGEPEREGERPGPETGVASPNRSGTASNVMEAPRHGEYRGGVVTNKTRAGARNDSRAT